MQRVTAGLTQINMYLDHAIALDGTPAEHVHTIRAFLLCLREHNLKLAPFKARIGSTHTACLGHAISPSDLLPDQQILPGLPTCHCLAMFPNSVLFLEDFPTTRSFSRTHRKDSALYTTAEKRRRVRVHSRNESHCPGAIHRTQQTSDSGVS